MFLSVEDERILAGEGGDAARKAMEILAALGDIFGADELIPIRSVQIAGVSYHNLGDAGLEFLAGLARDGRVKVPTFLNPAGMDLENWQALGIPPDFATKQKLVIEAFAKMGIQTTCTCTPYLIGIRPSLGDHVAWAESSAVTFCNSVLGARTNREGGPSALAAALIGKTPNYGLHLDEGRKPTITVKVETPLEALSDFGALGYVIGKKAENQIPLIFGVNNPNEDYLKSFCASVVTYGSKPLFHMVGVTPEADKFKDAAPAETITITESDIKDAYAALEDKVDSIDFVAIGCPHCSIDEIKEVADLLRDNQVAPGVELWICCARPIKVLADELGYSAAIEEAGGKFACDTCMAVAPLKGRFKAVATTSAKGCYYSRGHNSMLTKMGTIKQCIDAAKTGRWN